MQEFRPSLKPKKGEEASRADIDPTLRLDLLESDNARLKKDLADAIKENARLKRVLDEARHDNTLLKDLAAKKQR